MAGRTAVKSSHLTETAVAMRQSIAPQIVDLQRRIEGVENRQFQPAFAQEGKAIGKKCRTLLDRRGLQLFHRRIQGSQLGLQIRNRLGGLRQHIQ